MAVVAAQLHRARDDQHPPRALAAGDAHDQLVGAHAQHGSRTVPARAGVDRLAGLQGLREQAAPRRHVAAGGDPRALHVRRARHEAAGTELPDPDERRAGRDAHPVACLVQRVVHAARERRDLGEVGQQVDARGGVGERPVRGVGQAPREVARLGRVGDRGRRVRRGGGQEALEVDQAIASVTTIIDPVVAQPARLAPRPDRVRMHAQHMRRLRHRERRVAGPRGPGAGWRNVGFGKHRVGRSGSCGGDLVSGLSTTSQELPIGRCFHRPGPAREQDPVLPGLGGVRRPGGPSRASVDQRRGPASGLAVIRTYARAMPDGHHRDGRHHQDRRQRVTHQSGSLARAARVADARRRARRGARATAGAARKAAATAAIAAIAASAAAATGRRSEDGIDRPPARTYHQRDEPDAEQGRDQSRRVPMTDGQQPHRLRGLEGGHDERPAETGAKHRAGSPSWLGTPQAIAWSTLLSCSTRSRTRASGGVPAGIRSGTSAAVPSDSRVITTRPCRSRRRRPRSGRARRPPRTARPRAVLHGRQTTAGEGLEADPPGHEGAVVLVLELVLASIRPATATYRVVPASRGRRPATPGRPRWPRGSGRHGRRCPSSGGGSSRSRAARGGTGQEDGDHG